MIGTGNRLTLGTSMVDGSSVEIDPSMGPLTIYGNVGSGKTVTVRNLFHQLCASSEIGQTPVIAIDGSQQGYAHISREHGGSSVMASSESDPEVSGPDDDPSHLSLRRPILTIDASTLRASLHARSANSANHDQLRHVLTRFLNEQEPEAHIIVDPIDHLLFDQGCTNLLWQAITEAAQRNIMVVCVVSDPATLSAALSLDTQVLLNVGSTLLMAYNSHRLRHKDGTFGLIPPVMFDMAARSRPGEGVLLTSRGGLTNLSISAEEEHLCATLRIGTA